MQYPKAYDIKRTVNDALRTFYLNDLYLIEHDVHECALTFRLGFYLQNLFSGWDVDCEFNRDVGSPDGIKHLPDWKNDEQSLKDIIPDIIIHRRGTDCNLLVIEAKKNASDKERDDDIDKIKAYREEKTLHYCYGLFLDFRSTRRATVDTSVFFSKTGRSSLRIKTGSSNNEVK